MTKKKLLFFTALTFSLDLLSVKFDHPDFNFKKHFLWFFFTHPGIRFFSIKIFLLKFYFIFILLSIRYLIFTNEFLISNNLSDKCCKFWIEISGHLSDPLSPRAFNIHVTVIKTNWNLESRDVHSASPPFVSPVCSVSLARALFVFVFFSLVSY